MIDVANRAKVSPATVSRVLNGKDTAHFSAETADRVLAAASALNYRPSELGRSLRTSSTRTVALLVPTATGWLCADLASSLEPVLYRNGLSMLLCNTAESAEHQDSYLEEMISRGISSIVMLGAVPSPQLPRLSQDAAPLVFVNRRPPRKVRGDFVGIDYAAAASEVADHFLDSGYDNCAIIHGLRSDSASVERLAGFSQRLKKRGAPLAESARIESPLTPEAGYERGLELLGRKRRPRAVFCCNDSIAYGVYRAAVELGLKVPSDVALFGFDDNRMNRWLAPWLSTVHIPVEDFGPAIAEILTEPSTGPREPRTILLPHTLVLRDSA
ncbi:MAG TPA: LacI family DNA-binding transcriptional regulator [Devosia sp.]|nr:LacI family DNA-binding transcriptional regulator [Devosia sp.]